MDQVKFAAQLQNPNILKIYGIGKVDASYYISYEFLEGKSLQARLHALPAGRLPVLGRPRACSSRARSARRSSTRTRARTRRAARYFHGLVTPASVLVSYEGEVRAARLRLLAQPRARGGRAARGATRCTSRPSRRRAEPGDTRSDIFAVGAHPLRDADRASRSSRRRARRRSGRARGPGAAAEPDHRRRRAAQADRRHPAALARRGPRRALRGDPGDAQGGRHAALLRRLHAHHLQPRLLHALAVPRGHRARVEGR